MVYAVFFHLYRATPALPLCHRSIFMSPHRILPIMRCFIFFKYKFLIYFDPKSWTLRKLNITICKYKIFLIRYIVKYTLSYIVMNSNTLFLYHRIIAGCIHI